MVASTVIGALLVVGGLLYIALKVISRGTMSDPHSSRRDPAGPTLEPRHSGRGLFGLKSNWPGLLAIAIGVVMLLSPPL